MRIKKLLLFTPITIFTLVSCNLNFELSLPFGDTSEASSFRSEISSESSHKSEDMIIEENDEFSIHFLELGNKYSGDSVYIKANDYDILIDAGSRQNSASTLKKYINQHCEDGKLEYVIATHAHQDHIAAFVGKSDDPGIFKSYEIDTLIDFPKTNTTSQIYKSYCEYRQDLIDKGTSHYTALECYKNLNGASRSIELGKNTTLNILYQKYYEEKASSENDYSVCVLLSHYNNHYLFTGDLEKKGEESLVESNTLPQVKLFKGGHHGSGTSNTDKLLDVIKPENVCICTCAGTPEYSKTNENQFPYQETINRFAKHTENIYVTSQIDSEKSTSETYYTKSMNGNIVVYDSNDTFKIECSNNNTILKETEWFKKYRTWPETKTTLA